MNKHTQWLLALSLFAWGCDSEVSEPDPKAGETAGDMAGEIPAGEDPAGEDPAGEDPAGEDPAGEDPAGEDPAGEDPAGEDPAGEVPAGEVPAGEVPAGETPVAQCADMEDNDGDGAIDLEDPGCADETDDDESDDPVNNLCFEREVIDLNAALQGAEFVDYDLNDFGMSQTQGSCGGNAGPEAIFKYEVTTPLTRLEFTTDFAETAVPVVLFVREECEGNTDALGEDLICNRGAASAPGTSVALSEVAPAVYYVFVDTGSANVGPGAFRLAVNAQGAPQCRDEVDNDNDGLIDLNDPGCVEPDDIDETDPATLPECGDGVDNDNDQLIDYPNDPDCAAAGGDREAALCLNDYEAFYELDDEGGSLLVAFPEDLTESFTDGCRANSGPEAVVLLQLDEPSNVTVEFGDPDLSYSAYIRSTCDDVTSQISCVETLVSPLRANALEPGEYFLFIDAHTPDTAILPDAFPFLDVTITSLITECNDGVDNDADDLIDFEDIGCSGSTDTSEADPAVLPACADGADNDEDGFIDYPEDADCVAAGSRYETPGCLSAEPVAEVGLDGGVVSVNTAEGVHSYAASCGSSSSTAPERMIQLELSQPAAVNISIENGDFDSVLYIRSECETAEPASFCDDTGVAAEVLNFVRLEKGRYFVFVDGYFSDSVGVADVVFDITPLEQAACDDEEDNDNDGLIDINDPGCFAFYDVDETDEAQIPACADGNDNDGDDLIDYPNDPGCYAQGGATEDPACSVPAPTYQLGQAGGLVTHRFVDGGNFFTTACDAGEGVEAVIELTLDELSDVELTVNTGENFDIPAEALVSLRSACDPSAEELGCVPSASVTVPLAEAGVYYLIVERLSGVVAPDQDWQINVNVTSRIGECNDNEDNDLDSYVDLNDPGCTEPFDQSEADPDEVPECFDQQDNDGDGLIDYPEDTDCIAAGDDVEQRRCSAHDAVEVGMSGIAEYFFDPSTADDITDSFCSSSAGAEVIFAVTLDEPSSILVDAFDPDGDYANIYASVRRRCDTRDSEVECISAFPAGRKTFAGLPAGTYFVIVERSSSFTLDPLSIDISVLTDQRECSDEVDNDEDGLVDLLDTGCTSGGDNDETDPPNPPACGDEVDNDTDGATDYPADDFCLSAGQTSEVAICDAYNGAEGTNPDAEMIVVSETTTFSVDTSAPTASSAYQRATSAASPEIPFALQVYERSRVVIEFTAANHDTYLHMRADNCDNPDALVDYDDDGGEGRLSKLEFSSLPAGIYYVFVDGFGEANSGNVTVEVTIQATTGVVTACNDAQDNDQDALTDLDDPGCESAADNDETDPVDPPACAAGTDADGDGFNGYPDDPDCLAAGDTTDATYCAALPTQEITLSAEGATRFTTNPPALGDYVTTGSCGAAIGQPAVIVFDVDELSDVFVTLDAADSDTAGSNFDRAVSIRSDCDDEYAEVACAREVEDGASVKIGDLIPAGRYYLLVERRANDDAGLITVDLEIVSRITECNDGEDNNANGLIDLLDYGCVDGDSPSESVDPGAPLPVCADGVDNDGDNAIDYPDDPECTGAGGYTEELLCADYDAVIVSGTGGTFRYTPNGDSVGVNSCAFSSSGEAVFAIYVEQTSTVGAIVTDDSGGYASVYREFSSDCDSFDGTLGCFGLFDDDVATVSGLEPGWYFFRVHRSSFGDEPFNVELFIVPEVIPSRACNDEADNDNDGFFDLDDPGCASPYDDSEVDEDVAPACSDADDNDEDGLTDYPNDPDCLSAGDGTEATRCQALSSEDVVVPYGESAVSVEVDPIGAAESDDVGSCENNTGLGEAAVVSFEVPELSDLYVSLSGQGFDRLVYLRSACEDDPEVDNDEISCNTTGVDLERAVRLLPAGRYYLHVKRTNLLDINPVSVNLRLVSRVTECNDGEDNDLDGLVDLLDYGCVNGDDNTELTEDGAPLPVCADGEDNDEDGFTDYPEDEGCQAAGSSYETPGCLNIEPVAYVNELGGTIAIDTRAGENNYTATCSSFNGANTAEQMVQLELSGPAQVDISVSNASTGFDSVIYLRAECELPEPDDYCDDTGIANERLTFDRLEPGRYFVFVDGYANGDVGTLDLNFSVVSLITECNDGEDNDGDGLVDNDDVGCQSERDNTENSESEPDFVFPECADGDDNDGDGFADYPADPECTFAGGSDEAPSCVEFDFVDAGTEGGTFLFTPDDVSNDGLSCAFSAGDYAVYRIEITEFSRVIVDTTDASGEASSVYTAIRNVCDDAETELSCFSNFPRGPKTFSNLEAGYYFIFVHRSGFSDPDPFTVELTVESLIRECNDEVDNDGDMLIDDADPGCSDLLDDSENSDAEPDFVLPECSDGIDNDGDMQIDYPDDADCQRASGNSEELLCRLYPGEVITVSESTAEPLVFNTSTSQNYYQREGEFGPTATGPEIPFRLELALDSNVSITYNSPLDTYLHMRAGLCDDAEAEYAFDDDSGESFNAQVNLTAVPAGTYYVFVDGYNGDDSGEVSVDVVITPVGME